VGRVVVLTSSNTELLLDLLHSYRIKDVGPTTQQQQSVANKMESEDDHGSSGSYEVSIYSVQLVHLVYKIFMNQCCGAASILCGSGSG
jgi:hypothetical protein